MLDVLNNTLIHAGERAIAFDPDVILLDIGLPGMTGFELASKLHAHPAVARAKLIAITGYGQAGDPEHARDVGFDGYLVKPVDMEELRACIDAILHGAKRAASARGAWCSFVCRGTRWPS